MDREAYKNFLLHAIPSAKSASGGREVVCRCFYCPDSKDPRHGHFYISIPQSDKEPSLYHCMKCGASGIVTQRTLLEWNTYDDQIAIELIHHNKHIDVNIRNKMYKVQKVPMLNPFTRDDNGSQIKLQYIADRIGIQYTYDQLRELKIVLNLKDVLQANQIQELTRKPMIIDQLDANFLGFLSIDNTHLNMRRVCDEGLVYQSIDKRYVNYELKHLDNSRRMYTIPTAVDLNQPDRVKIHIAEGPFDILSIYDNLRHREPGIYSSVAGSNYYGTILFFIETYKLPYTEVHIYPDNDDQGNNNKMMFIRKQMKRLRVPVYIHRNLYPGEKDFGVPMSRIQEVIEGEII